MHLELHRHLVHRAEQRDPHAQRGAETLPVDVAGVQRVDETPELREGVPGQVADAIQVGAQRGVLARDGVRGLRGEGEAEQRLRHGVMQVPGDAGALLNNGQLSQPLLALGVHHGQRGVPGQRLDHLLVGVGELGAALLLRQVQPGDRSHPRP